MNNLEKEKLPTLRGRVNLGNGIIGSGSNQPGDKFYLERLWAIPKNLSTHRPTIGYEIPYPTTAYIRTADGNIYKVDSEGEFTNGGTGKKHKFEIEEMKSNPIFEIGKPFNFMGKDLTEPITEIIYHDDVKQDTDNVPNASLIKDDFLRLVARAEK
jgi:hypothetical protein